MAKRPTIAVELVNQLIKAAFELHLDAAGALQTAGITEQELAQAGNRIEATRLDKAWQHLTANAPPGLGLHIAGISWQGSGSGIVPMMLANSPDVGTALRNLARYHALLTDFVTLTVDIPREAGSLAQITWVADAQIAARLDHQYAETVFVSLVHTLGWLTDGAAQPVEIHFTHAVPENTQLYEQTFGCPVRFEQDANRVIVQQLDLVQPIRLANPALLATLRQFADAQLTQLESDTSTTSQVASCIQEMLWRGTSPNLDTIAHSLSMSRRLVQKRLQAEGTTYRSVLDAVRGEMARDLLDAPSPNLCEIALLLGFAEQSAFNHAFLRWTGMSPSAFREIGGKTS